jgi:hypothetical protein
LRFSSPRSLAPPNLTAGSIAAIVAAALSCSIHDAVTRDGRTVPSRSATAGAHGSAAAETIGASFVVKVPAKFAAIASARTPRSIPARAQSIALAVAPSASCTGCTRATTFTAGFAANAANCEETLAATACTIPMRLAPGSYNAVVSVYDGPLDAAGAVTGTLLSRDQRVAIDVDPDTINVTAATFEGVPHGIAFSLVDGGGKIAPDNRLAIGRLGGKVLVRAAAVDADGAIIIGPHAPVVTLRTTLQNGLFTARQDPATKLVAVTAPEAPIKKAATLTFGLDACSAPKSACTATLTVAQAEVLAVSDSSGRVAIYRLGEPMLREATAIDGVEGATYLAFDAQADLFVLIDRPPYAVKVFAPPYTGRPKAVVTNGIDDPRSMAVTASGDLFVGNGNDTVTHYAPPYTGRPTSITRAGIARPNALAVSKNGTLYVANLATSTITSYAPPYSRIAHVTSSGIAGPAALTLTRDGTGNLFVANTSSDTVTEYDAAGLRGPLHTIAVGPDPVALASFDDTVAIAASDANAIAVARPPYTGTPTTVNSASAQTWGLAFDAYQNVYAAEWYPGFVQQFAAPRYAGASPDPAAVALTSPRALATWP